MWCQSVHSSAATPPAVACLCSAIDTWAAGNAAAYPWNMEYAGHFSDAAGGALCISLLLHGYYDILSSVMLLFYGLTLVNVSKFTYANIAWLGYAFICLGVIDSFWEGHALLFWTIGFGGFHILYGILFYLHYERKQS